MAAAEPPERAPQAAPASGGDLIGALPDELLHHVLSFLPAQQAVQTCVLARRWLDLWKSATGLRIVGADGKSPARFVREFVDSLLLHRGSAPLETFELSVDGDVVDDCRVMIWVRYAVQCKVQVLLLCRLGGQFASLQPEDPPLASRHLTKLELLGLRLNDDFLDFSRCPELQDLKITQCSLEHAERISSRSLRRLNIRRCYLNQSIRTRIHAPNLASLVLEVIDGRTPVLERMPLLIKAVVGINGILVDYCSSSYGGYRDSGDESCEGRIRDDSASVLLCGMSQAEVLVLSASASSDMFIFRRDLNRCFTFGQLKTLMLDEYWCVPDEYPLACILENSPVLERLFLCLFYKADGIVVEMKGMFNQKELPPTLSSQLKRVEIICGGVDGSVLKVLRFLSKLNINFSFTE